MSIDAPIRPAASGQPVRVAIDASAFVSPAAGVRRYVTELTRAIRLRFGDRVEVVGVGRRPVQVAGQALPHVSEGPSPPTNFGRCLFGLPAAIARAGAAVFHAPAYTAPLRGTTPTVVSIHDVSYERCPEWYPYRRDPLRRWFYRASARRASRIITVSEFSRREIEAAYAVEPERIFVVPNGVGQAFGPAGSGGCRREDHDRVGRVLSGGTGPFLLHVGDIHARRDLALAVRVTAALRGRGGVLAGLRLVLVGTDRGALAEVTRAAEAARIADALVVAGGFDDRTLAALYRCASALIYPSRYEGFGLPLVEAMASSLPVVAARAGATPEVVGDSAILVGPGDERAFVDALVAILVTSPERAAAMADRGRRQAERFTWDRAAEQTVEVYESCLHRTSR